MVVLMQSKRLVSGPDSPWEQLPQAVNDRLCIAQQLQVTEILVVIAGFLE